MKQVNLIGNTLYSGIANASSIFLLLVLVFAGRFLGADEFGKFTFALALVTTVSLLSDFGVSTLVLRNVARTPESASLHFGNLATLKAFLSTGAILISVAAIHFLRPDQDVRLAVAVLALAAALKSMKLVPVTFFQALERFDLYALSYSIHNVGFFIVGTVALWRGAGLVTFVGIFAAFKLADTAFSYALAKRTVVRIAPKFDFSFMKRLQIEALPLGMYVVINEVYSYADTILLSILRTDVEVGWYNGAYKLFEGLAVFPLLLSQAIAPQLARLFQTDASAHRVLASRSIKFGAMAAGLVVLSGIVIGKDLILFLFGPAYTESVPVFEILLFTFLLIFFNMIFQVILITIDRQGVMPWMGLSGLATVILAGLLLIPRYGHIGAAWAFLASELVVFLFGVHFLYRFCFRSWFLRVAARPLLSGVLVLAALVSLDIERRFAFVLLVVPTYMVLLLLLQSFDEEEMGVLRRIFSFDRFRSR